MLLIWHEALGTDDEQATEEELCARVLYSYEDCNLLSSLHLVQGLLAFARTFRRSGDGNSTKGTATTEWTPEWASVTLSRRRFFILEVEPKIFMALGVQPTVEIKDHRCGYEALLREIYGMFRLFHGSIDSNLRLLPSVGGSVESDMTPKKNTDGMDLLMDIAAVRIRLRKLRLAIDSLTYNKPLDVTSEDKQQDEELQQDKKTTEAELEALMAKSPATSLQKKCAGFFPTLLQSLNVRNSSAFSELQGLGYFPMDQPTFLALQTFVNGFHSELRSSKSDVEAENLENLALFFKGNLLWSSLETTTMHLLYKFLRLREKRGMTMLRGDNQHDVDDLHPGLTLSNNADSKLWMANAYEDTFLPVWSSKLSYTECDVVAQSKDGRPRARKSARSLHKQHPVSLLTFLSEAPPSCGSPASTPRPGPAAEPSQFCPSHSPASLTRFGGAPRSGTSSANLQSAIRARARSPSFRNAGLMLKSGCFSKLLHANREMHSERVWSEIERVWSPPIFLLDGVSTSVANTTSTVMAARHRVVVWHEADLTMVILLRLDETEHDSTGAVPTSLNADTIERLKDYLEEQQRFQTLAQLILSRYTATFAPQTNIPPLSPFLYINRVNLAFRMQQVPRLLKSKEDELFPVPDNLLVHYFPASTASLVNDLHAKLHELIIPGNREICVLTRHAGWVFAKKSETSHRELYVFIDTKVGSSLYDLSDAATRPIWKRLVLMPPLRSIVWSTISSLTLLVLTQERSMTDEQLQREEAHLRIAINIVANHALKTYMLTALDAFHTSTSSTISSLSTSTTQTESDQNDAITVKLREASVTVQKPRDALFLAIHALLLEAGYKLAVAKDSEFVLPENWDANSANGLFKAEYVHPNDESIKLLLQGLFVGDKFEVYISDDKNHIHSIGLSLDKFVALSESKSPLAAASLLQNLKDLRETFTPFAESIQPASKKKTTPVVTISGVHSPDRDRRDYGAPSTARIPPVGEGDAFPPGLGGGNPDMLVGPDHPLFGNRGDPSRGPVPGARFDPFGPSIDPLGPSNFHRPPPRGPAPTMPFGGPEPDHLRMPRDDEMDPNFGSSGRGRRGGHPFGSDHSFF